MFKYKKIEPDFDCLVVFKEHFLLMENNEAIGIVKEENMAIIITNALNGIKTDINKED